MIFQEMIVWSVRVTRIRLKTSSTITITITITTMITITITITRRETLSRTHSTRDELFISTYFFYMRWATSCLASEGMASETTFSHVTHIGSPTRDEMAEQINACLCEKDVFVQFLGLKSHVNFKELNFKNQQNPY